MLLGIEMQSRADSGSALHFAFSSKDWISAKEIIIVCIGTIIFGLWAQCLCA